MPDTEALSNRECCRGTQHSMQSVAGCRYRVRRRRLCWSGSLPDLGAAGRNYGTRSESPTLPPSAISGFSCIALAGARVKSSLGLQDGMRMQNLLQWR
jgi:hypothetical protein